MTVDAKYIQRLTGFRVKAVKSCRSTFDEIGNNDVIIAQAQRDGVGRGDHTFFSPPGGLYIVMRKTGLNIDQHTLTPSVGLAVHDAIKAVLGLDTGIKWVNDVMYGDKKVCGILCKRPRVGEYLIGVGVNFSTSIKVLQSEGLYDAGTLDAPIDKATPFAAELIRRIHAYTLKPFDAQRYNALCITVGRAVTFERGGMTVKGIAERVETDGTLIVRIGMATVAVDAGEVSLIREQTA